MESTTIINCGVVLASRVLHKGNVRKHTRSIKYDLQVHIVRDKGTSKQVIDILYCGSFELVNDAWKQ